ncbi:MAG: winged helix-turn-helix domain-containing protein [Williamsia sp.]|nr:winged helix-turn-helix domain-containing protein [Williamsia sp.]
MRTPKTPEEFRFNRFDKQRFERALQKASDKRAFQRIQAVQLFAQGMDIHAVARIACSSVRIVYKWIRLYLKDHQTNVLHDAPRTGRPVVAPKITAKQILKELEHNPLDLGYNTRVWTAKLLASHLGECFVCKISSLTMYRRMKQIGLRCKRPRYVYSEKDPNRAQKKGLCP